MAAKKQQGSDMFIVDNSDKDWKVLRYLHDWCQLSETIDIATGYFEIGSLLALKDEWQKVDKIRILMGDEVSLRTKKTFIEGLAQVIAKLDDSLEAEKDPWPTGGPRLFRPRRIVELHVSGPERERRTERTVNGQRGYVPTGMVRGLLERGRGCDAGYSTDTGTAHSRLLAL